MESQATLAELGRRLLLWFGIPGFILASLVALVFFRDSYAVGRDEYTADKVGYSMTADKTVENCRRNNQSTINGYLDQITNINIRKAGAAQEVRAVLLLLENTMNQQIATAETEKAKC